MENFITFGDLLEIAKFCVSFVLLLVTIYYNHKKK